MTSGQGSHWLIESPAIVALCVARLSEMFVSFVFIHFAAFIQSVDFMFYSCIFLLRCIIGSFIYYISLNQPNKSIIFCRCNSTLL